MEFPYFSDVIPPNPRRQAELHRTELKKCVPSYLNLHVKVVI